MGSVLTGVHVPVQLQLSLQVCVPVVPIGQDWVASGVQVPRSFSQAMPTTYLPVLPSPVTALVPHFPHFSTGLVPVHGIGVQLPHWHVEVLQVCLPPSQVCVSPPTHSPSFSQVVPTSQVPVMGSQLTLRLPHFVPQEVDGMVPVHVMGVHVPH